MKWFAEGQAAKKTTDTILPFPIAPNAACQKEYTDSKEAVRPVKMTQS
jgi:hypothetical protein